MANSSAELKLSRLDTQPLRITFFTALGSRQGTYVRWHNLARGLRNLGADVVVMTIDDPNEHGGGYEERDGVPYHVVPIARGQRLFGQYAHPVNVLRRSLASAPVSDVFHVFQPFPASCIPALLQRRRARLLVFDWDDLWHGGLLATNAQADTPLHQRLGARAIGWLERYMPRHADALTTCSEYLAGLGKARGARHVQVLHNGFWKDADPVTRAFARSRFGMKADCYYFGFMGRTIGELDWCFDVLRMTQESALHVRLALCGMAPEALAALPGEMTSRIDYLGFLGREDVALFARAIDCGLLPLELNPFNESRFPIKFPEYLAGGASVLCSEVGEIAKLGRAIPAVTLAGNSRADWRAGVTRVLAERAHSASAPDCLGWGDIAQELLTFYRTRLNACTH